jgi:hypothetical protein
VTGSRHGHTSLSSSPPPLSHPSPGEAFGTFTYTISHRIFWLQHDTVSVIRLSRLPDANKLRVRDSAVGSTGATPTRDRAPSPPHHGYAAYAYAYACHRHAQPLSRSRSRSDLDTVAGPGYCMLARGCNICNLEGCADPDPDQSSPFPTVPRSVE